MYMIYKTLPQMVLRVQVVYLTNVTQQEATGNAA
jgi:hypothetical protein